MIYVIEWKENFEWVPTLEVAFSQEDIKKKARNLRRAHPGKIIPIRVARYERYAGRKP